MSFECESLRNLVTPKRSSSHQHRSAVLSLGYRASSSHACQQSIKTNAPPSVLWDIIKHWVKNTPLKGAQKESTPSFTILSIEPQM